MKKLTVIFAAMIVLIFSSCKKEYNTYNYYGTTDPPKDTSAIYVSLAPGNPQPQTVAISSGQTTYDVKFLSFNLKSDTNVVIQSIAVDFSVLNMPIQNVLASLKMEIDGNQIGIGKIVTTDQHKGIASFDDLNIVIDENTGASVQLLVDVLPGSYSDVKIKAGVNAENIKAVYPNYDIFNGKHVGSADGNTLTLSSFPINIINVSNNCNAVVNNNGAIIRYDVCFTFDVVNSLISNDIYLSKAVNSFLVTGTVQAGPGTGLTGLVALPGSVGGDNDNYYLVNAGTSRRFNVYGSIFGSQGTTVTLKVCGMQYSIDPAGQTLFFDCSGSGISAVVHF